VVEKRALCVRLRRLFDMAENKDVTVDDMCGLDWRLEGEGWKWRHKLFAWEEKMWRECCTILSNIVLHYFKNFIC